MNWVSLQRVLLAASLGRIVNGASLHGPGPDRKLVLYGPEDGTKDVKSYWDAWNFCYDKGRVLATRFEWCDANFNNWGAEDVFGGIKEGEQWAPVRGPFNDWVQVGKLWGADHFACQTYSEIFNVGVVPSSQTPAPVPQTYCGKPKDCKGNHCEYTCSNDHGYYPDPNDCQAYCYCSGGTGTSFWEKIEGDGMVWDPFCDKGGVSSNMLNVKEGVKAGTTGGCERSETYLNNKDHCDGGNARRELFEQERKLWQSYPQPHWGNHNWGDPGSNDKYHGEANYILCTKLEETPEMPDNCACVWGDPHVNTYDGLNYDCQGQGDYVLQRGLDTGLELQARFKNVGDNQASVTKHISIKTGFPNEPTVEIDTTYNYMRYYADGEEVALEHKFITEGTYAFERPNIHFIYKWPDRYFWFPQSGISLHYRFKRSKKLGTYLNACLCVPDDVKEKNFVGMFGSPDGKPGNDFMDRTGKDLEHGGNTPWQFGYDHCTKNWCIDDNNDNNFLKPGNPEDCKIPYDPTIENEVKNAPKALRDVCGTNTACLIDGAVGSVEDSADSVKEKEELKVNDPVVTEESQEETEEEVLKEEANQKNAEQDECETDKKECANGSFVSRNREDGCNFFECPKGTGGDKEGAGTTPAQSGVEDKSSDNFDGTTNKAYSKGDPHIKPFGRSPKFDFHGECDLVLLTNRAFRGLGLDVNIRTKINTWWSFISHAVIRIGTDTLEVTGDPTGSGVHYWLNGEEGDPLEDKSEFAIAGFQVIYREINAHQHRFRVDLGGDNALVLESFKEFVSVNTKAGKDGAFYGSSGLLGSFPDGRRMARDYYTVMDDPVTFGKEWQVLITEPMLFHTADGTVQHPTKCIMPNTDPGTVKRRLGEALITEEAAEELCAHVAPEDNDNCIFDVMATNDEGIAGSY